ncbi:flagellar hook protein FlgE [Desulfurobacterium pacificum]|uniref:Flagellar hook protein FlgE n=1 Tax=Desulfurobacterium pacificum TaxID=240166 RepID=A0ABY1NN36_9BACT|nr:flagellar hook protein FlgE [Desulfurobacterium pacificum]SMP13809.1 flagellar hook protein FlgE [Desulfurobacterium pacificum]
MLQSFYTAFTGLTADKTWLSVISDNIANVNTIGYKAERAVFEDLLARSLTTFKNGAPVNQEIGGGTYVAATVKDFSQGTFMNTNNPLDLALDGEGFFMVKDSAGVTYYTRNGEFRLDANGDLINMQGMKVQGWMLDENGNLAGAIGNINVPMDMNPKSTTYVAFDEPSNLDSRAAFIVDNPNTADVDESIFNPANSLTYNYVNAVTVYDSLGNPHELDYYFIHKQDTSGNAYWLVYASLDGKPVEIPKDGSNYAFLKISFKTDGSLDTTDIKGFGAVTDQGTETLTESSDSGEFTLSTSPVVPGSLGDVTYTVGTVTRTLYDDGKGNLIDKDTGDIRGSIDYSTGKIYISELANNGSTDSITVASYQTYDSTESTNALDPKQIETAAVSLNNGAAPMKLSFNILNLKQVASDFIFYAEQDGNSKGDLIALAVSEDGVIKATYSNGKVKDIARLAIATFKDKEMLVRKGEGLYLPNMQTFTPVIMPGGVISKVRSGMLEMSNVDIANEFINLITAQRSYQANARVITTDDQILQETMNIKR